MQYITCNYCGQDDTELVNRGPDLLLNQPGDYALVRCRNCGLIYQNPQSTHAEISQFYPDDYLLYTTAVQGKTAASLKRLSDEHAQKRRWQRIMHHISTPGSILDIGCATGQFLNAMQMNGWQAAGVELSEFAADFARQNFGLDVTTGTLEEANFPDMTFNVITLWDVFEHVINPKETLKKIARILKPGGFIVLGLPNPDSLEARLFGSNWVGWERPRHLHLFTRDVLQRYLEDAGFELASVESFSGRLSVTLLSIEFMLKARGIPEERFGPWLEVVYNWPLRLATWPFYKLGEVLNKTTGMTIFAQLQ